MSVQRFDLGAMVLAAALGACSAPPGRLPVRDGGPVDDAGNTLPDGSVPWVRQDSGPDLPGADRVVVLPLGAAESILTYTVSASPALLDVHLSVDTTSSFVEEIAAIQASLSSSVIPAIRALVPNSSFGVSYFQDFPGPPFGDSTDRPFVLLQRITSDVGAVASSVGRLDDRIGNGGDVYESGYEALYQIATGAGYSNGGTTLVPRFSGAPATGGGSIGGVGFRADSFRVVVHATDAPAHESTDYGLLFPDAHGSPDALAALTAQRIHLVGVTNGGQSRNQLSDLAIATGAVMDPIGGSCPTGANGSAHPPVLGTCPLVFDVFADGTGLGPALTQAVSALVENIRYGAARGFASDDRIGFVRAVEANHAAPPTNSTGPAVADSTPGDGYPDTFVSVASGTILTFRVHLENLTFASQTYEQTFRVRVRIVADDALVVDEWIRIVVPALH